MGLYRETIGPAQPTVLDKWVELMVAYARRIGKRSERRRRRDLAALWERVDTNLAHPWTCRGLAEEANISGETLRRLCHRENDHGPMRHLAELRMRRAAMLLESTELKVDAIARMVGYSSAFAFSTAFKRQVGHSPAQYRQFRRHDRRRRHAVRSPRVDPFEDAAS
jgi:transcriptional regulator GlxA family with amidase domain